MAWKDRAKAPLVCLSGEVAVLHSLASVPGTADINKQFTFKKKRNDHDMVMILFQKYKILHRVIHVKELI